MEPIQLWTGRAAATLQGALRMSNESFAQHLGIAPRTVAMWHQKPDRVPQPDVQKMLDTALSLADEGAQQRFSHGLPHCDTSAGVGRPDEGDSLAAGADLTADPESAIIGDGESGGSGGESMQGWLHVAPSATAPPDGSDVGEILRWYRIREGLSQQAVATRLNTTQSRLSKLEKGTQILRDIEELRRLARQLGIPPERLGVLPNRSGDAHPLAAHVSDQPGPGRDSQEHWREVRGELNSHRAALGDLAAELYPRQLRIPDTTVLTSPDWLPDGLVDLADVTLEWRTTAPTPRITGKDPASTCARPLMASGQRYDRYSRALRDLARPRLLDNRISYRLLDVSWGDNKGSASFNYTTYFDVLDVGESLAHEFTEAWLKAGRKRPSFADLAFRRTIDDPFDLAARPMLPSINTLTIRHDPIEGHRMYLHRRDAKAVAAAGGMYHVTPAGAFQPAALAPAHQSNDFSLWRNIQREFSEEFLGNAEHDGNGIEPIAYDTDEPFVSFEHARQAGDFRVFACAVVLEPLTLWAEFLTIAVIAAPAFDKLFSTMVAINEEGAAVSTEAGQPTTGIPFTADARERLQNEPLSPISRACIELAWRNRKELLR